MATRHQARTAVVGLLYAYDLGNENIGKYSDEILEEGKIRNKQKEFSDILFQGTIENLEMLDAKIKEHLKYHSHWTKHWLLVNTTQYVVWVQ